MPDADLAPLSTIGFGTCALAYLVLLALLTVRSRGHGSGRLLLLAVIGEVAFNAEGALAPAEAAPLFHGLAETIRNFGWVAFILSLVRPGRMVWLGAAALMLAPLLADHLVGTPISSALRVIVAVMALVCLEQVWRSTAPNRRWAMKFLCLALFAKFGFDLATHSDSLLFGRIDPVWWTGSGYANALLVPFIAVAAARNRDWMLDVNVSRHVVFHSVTLLAAGIFLLAVAIGGYILKFFGGSPGAVAATMLAFVAVVLLIVLVGSGTVRSKLRVQLAKHFFSYRYDYRHEWLKLTRNLEVSPEAAGGEERRSAEFAALAQRGLNSLMDLVESPGGVLWIKDESGTFRSGAQLGRFRAVPVLEANEPWVSELHAEQWILDLRGGRGAATLQISDSVVGTAAKAASVLPEWLLDYPDAAFMVPLLLDEELIGVALLHRPRVDVDLDWEARDLLRIAARQVAGFLTLRRTVEALVQARQFESFNRMSAFVVHDLKNLVAQLSLMMRNAERHKENPDFQADMLDTVRNVLERMQGLLLQLGTGAKPVDAPGRIVLAEAIRAAVQSRSALNPRVRLELDPTLEGLQVTAHQDRLVRVIGHLIQNAADASGEDDVVAVRTLREEAHAVIQITDSGHGMTEDFVREKLFQPFSSTKAEGMGIGAFESREYIRELSGSIDVFSRPSAGTTFIVRLPVRPAARTAEVIAAAAVARPAPDLPHALSGPEGDSAQASVYASPRTLAAGHG